MCSDSEPSNLALDSPCSDDHLAILAKDLTAWEKVACALGLSGADVEDIDLSYKSLPRKRIKMLMKWKKKCKENATYQRLIQPSEKMRYGRTCSRSSDAAVSYYRSGHVHG